MRASWGSRRLVFLVVGLALLVGASALQAQSPGFLSDYSRLAPDPEDPEVTLTYQNPDYSAEDFDRLRLADLAFVVYPQDAQEEFSREKAAKIVYLQQRFSEILRDALKKEGVRLAERGGAGVLDCRWAVTNLGRSNIMAELLPLTQEMDGFTREGIRGVTFESECVDGGSGEPVFLEVEAGEGTSGGTDFTSWPGVEDRLERDAQDLADELVSVAKKARRGSRR